MQANTQPFKNINAQLVDDLGQRIINGYYKEGEQLPVEADLCTEFGVSRSIMREATKILSAKGLLSSRPRIGTMVRERLYWNLLDSEVLTWITQTMKPKAYMDMMFEARMTIEPRASALAAEKATKKDIKLIKEAYEDMAAAGNMKESLMPDIRFHQAIMDATHNDIIRYMGHTLHSTLALSIQLTSWHSDIYFASLPRHEAVYKAIANGDSEAALQATRVLLQKSRDDFDSRKNSKKPAKPKIAKTKSPKKKQTK